MSEFVVSEGKWFSPQNLEGEVWKEFAVIGKAIYSISNYGRAKTDKGPRGTRILHFNYNSQGYARVNIRGKFPFVHRLVADAFCEHPEGKDIVDHINSIKTDNRAENLRFVTTRENLMNPITKERRHAHTIKQDAPEEIIYKVLPYSPIVVQQMNSVREVCEATGYSESTIRSGLDYSRVCLGGFVYVRKDDYPKYVEEALRKESTAKSTAKHRKTLSRYAPEGVQVVLGTTEPKLPFSE